MPLFRNSRGDEMGEDLKREWKNEKNQLHRIDGPAVEYSYGRRKEWYIDGLRHRIGGPALEYCNGRKEWYERGLLHRTDGPAVVHADGKEEWHERGLLHRTDGPAVVHPDGREEWWLNGKRHRTDGPAIREIFPPMGWNRNEWYQNGELHRPDGPAVECGNRKEWWLNGKRHRTDGPAIEDMKEGNELKWYENGLLHRINGPAVIFGDGRMEWWLNGKRHRADGPAIIIPSQWFLNGDRIPRPKTKKHPGSSKNKPQSPGSDSITLPEKIGKKMEPLSMQNLISDLSHSGENSGTGFSEWFSMQKRKFLDRLPGRKQKTERTEK